MADRIEFVEDGLPHPSQIDTSPLQLRKNMPTMPREVPTTQATPGSQPIGFAQVRQALDEVQQRLQTVVTESEEVMRFHARAEPMKDEVSPSLPGDRTDATVWEDLATRAVLLSRSIESLERNLKVTLDTLR